MADWNGKYMKDKGFSSNFFARLYEI